MPRQKTIEIYLAPLNVWCQRLSEEVERNMDQLRTIRAENGRRIGRDRVPKLRRSLGTRQLLFCSAGCAPVAGVLHVDDRPGY